MNRLENNPNDIIDPLIDEAKLFVAISQRCSVSAIQRKFRIGYNRGARIVDHLEKIGVVSAPTNEGKRMVLINPLNQ